MVKAIGFTRLCCGDKVKKLLCWLLGHKNTISVVSDDWQYLCDRCELCKQNLPKGYPW